MNRKQLEKAAKDIILSDMEHIGIPESVIDEEVKKASDYDLIMLIVDSEF